MSGESFSTMATSPPRYYAAAQHWHHHHVRPCIICTEEKGAGCFTAPNCENCIQRSICNKCMLKTIKVYSLTRGGVSGGCGGHSTSRNHVFNLFSLVPGTIGSCASTPVSIDDFELWLKCPTCNGETNMFDLSVYNNDMRGHAFKQQLQWLHFALWQQPSFQHCVEEFHETTSFLGYDGVVCKLRWQIQAQGFDYIKFNVTHGQVCLLCNTCHNEPQWSQKIIRIERSP